MSRYAVKHDDDRFAGIDVAFDIDKAHAIAGGEPPILATYATLLGFGLARQPETVFRERKGQHSAKPDWFAATIERLYPGVPKLELFARAARPGWDAWGFEAGPPTGGSEAPVALSKAGKAGPEAAGTRQEAGAGAVPSRARRRVPRCAGSAVQCAPLWPAGHLPHGWGD